MNKITIVPSYARTSVMKQLVADQKNPFDKQVLSLSSFKNSLLLEPQDEKEEEALLFDDIKNHISKENIFHEQLSFPTFFNYFYDFAKTLTRNRITIDDLPEKDQQDKSKKEILSYFLKQNIIEKQKEDALENIEDVDGVEILDYFYNDLSDQKDIDRLIKKGARFVSDRKDNQTKYSCRYANNPVKEVIGVAQDLVSNKTDLNKCLIMLNDKETYIPIIRRIFEYYNIPYSLQIEKTNYEARRFLALLNFLRKQDLDSFIHAYNYRCFFKSSYLLIDYINNVNLEFEQLYKPLNYINELIDNPDNKEYINSTFGTKNLSNLKDEEIKCEKTMETIRPRLEKMKDYKNKTLAQQCTFAYNYLYSKLDAEKISKNMVSQIQDIHELCKAMVTEDKGSFELLSYELSKLKIKQNINYDCEISVKIVDSYCDIRGYENAIILGCAQQNYPKNVARADFFDEQYISNIKNYPSLIERSDYFYDQYKKLLSNFKEVIFSYPMASVDAHEYQRSMLIDDYVETTEENGNKVIVEKPWVYSEDDNYINKAETISPEVAKELYLKDKMLKCSPSDFEQYVKCPFSYFVQRGLGISDEESLEINSLVIGNIQHNLLEKSFKNEIKLDENTIDQYLTPYFELIKQVIQNKDEEIDATKERLLEGLKNSVNFLNEFKAVDDYEYHPEEKIEDFAWELNGNKLKFTGKIDRLDTKDKNYRIIDYKSSDKSASLPNVKKGINFQLLSYLVLYYLQQEDKELNPEMFAYLSLKNGKIDKVKEDAKYEKTDQQLRREETKYNAYLTSDMELDNKFYHQANFSGQRSADAKKEGDFEEIKTIIEKIFTTISNKILSGDISIEPTNNACEWCKYSDICHFNGEDTSKEEMEDLTV